MKKHLKYLIYVIRHKWFVLIAGWAIGAPTWRLFIHDWSKFLPSEWMAYAEWFYGEHGAKFKGGQSWEFAAHDRAYEAFNRAWNAHQKRNKHHWQYWLLMFDDGDGEALPIPRKYALEMLADWMGAGRAITGSWEIQQWWAENKDDIEINDLTAELIESKINMLSYDWR